MEDAILAALQWLADFFGGGGDAMRSWVEQTTTAVLEQWLLWSLKAKLGMVSFAWGVAKQMLIDTGVTSQLAQAWGAIPPQYMPTLNFFKVPEAVGILLNAGVTKFVLKFLPKF